MFWVCSFVYLSVRFVIIPKVKNRLFFIWIGPGQSKRRLHFDKDPDYILNTKKKKKKSRIFKYPIFSIFSMALTF